MGFRWLSLFISISAILALSACKLDDNTLYGEVGEGSSTELVASSMSGEPADYSMTTTLDVTVAGVDVTDYQYKIVSGSSADCANAAGYSADTPVATKITDDITALPDGEITVCAVGKNSDGEYESLSSASYKTWRKDTVLVTADFLHQAATPLAGLFNENSSRNFTVSLSAAKPYNVIIDYKIATDDAVANVNYNVLGTSMTIPAGQKTATFVVDLPENAVVETPKSFYVVLDKAQKPQVNLGNSTWAASAVQDNDGPVPKLISAATVGDDHSCAILADGKLKCWGANSQGQLGDGTVNTKTVPTAIDAANNYQWISGGYRYTCGIIATTGVLKCWGYNANNQLGDGTATQRNTPTIIDGGVSYQIVEASKYGGGTHTCGITTPGQMKCWGKNGAGQLGDGTTTDRTTPTSIDILTTYQGLSLGRDFTCAIVTASGALKCWGTNTQGQLGDGTTTQRTTPVDIDLGIAYQAVASGGYHACGITTAGILKCWGDNLNGQLGDGTTTDRLLPTIIDGGVNYAHVSAGSAHTCAVTTTGILKCWGNNYFNQLGDGSKDSRTAPVVIDSGVTYQSVTAGDGHTCAVTTTNTLKCWGYTKDGRVGDGLNSNPTSAVNILDSGTYQMISARNSEACGVTTTGVLKCWGLNQYGQLGDGTTTRREFPTEIDQGVTYQFIGVGVQNACGITTAGVLKCWGAGGSGQLGDGTTVSHLKPITVDSGVTYQYVAVGGGHVCAITSAGILKCWGDNSFGQLGDGTNTNRLLPTIIDSGVNYQYVSSTNAHTCGVAAVTGVLKCWGDNTSGVLGDGTTTDRLSPVIIDGAVSYQSVSAGVWSTCAITAAGVLKCWGENSFRSVGDGTNTDRLSPVVIDAGTSYQSVSSSSWINSCGVTIGGELKCWGVSGYALISGFTPTGLVEIVTHVSVAVGSQFACSLTNTGNVRCSNGSASATIASAIGRPITAPYPKAVLRVGE